jgi:hypothetical protein
MNNRRASPEEYDDSNLFSETYAGRTLLPADLDVFIKGNANFEKVCKYLRETYKCNVYNNQEHAEPRAPYFIETNPELKKVLKYYHIVINSLVSNTQMRRLFGVLRCFLPETFLRQLENGVVIKLDVIVLADNWKEVELDDYYDEYDLSPPFKNPDFRCNQLSLVKQTNSTKWLSYTLKSNWNFIPDVYEHNYDGIIACMFVEIKKIQREADNLKIITDDIIAKRAIPVLSSKLVDTHRIVKMENKGYTVDIVSMLPKQLVHKAPLQTDDKCIICFEEFTTGSIILKPCKCSGLIHAVCWAQLVNIENSNHRYDYRCPNCRHQQDICIRYSGNINTCKLANMLSALKHYRTDVLMRPFREMVCNMCTRTHRDTYNYEQDDEDDEDDEDDVNDVDDVD